MCVNIDVCICHYGTCVEKTCSEKAEVHGRRRQRSGACDSAKRVGTEACHTLGLADPCCENADVQGVRCRPGT